MDRDPEELLHQMDPETSQRVVVLGDAAHTMSPFKGQGANQALTDGPLLASWLQRACLSSAVKGFMREMTKRTAVKVRASREAALLLHSLQILDTQFDFAGVKVGAIPELLLSLTQRNIDAEKSSQLDLSVREVIEELGMGVDKSS